MHFIRSLLILNTLVLVMTAGAMAQERSKIVDVLHTVPEEGYSFITYVNYLKASEFEYSELAFTTIGKKISSGLRSVLPAGLKSRVEFAALFMISPGGSSISFGADAKKANLPPARIVHDRIYYYTLDPSSALDGSLASYIYEKNEHFKRLSFLINRENATSELEGILLNDVELYIATDERLLEGILDVARGKRSSLAETERYRTFAEYIDEEAVMVALRDDWAHKAARVRGLEESELDSKAYEYMLAQFDTRPVAYIDQFSLEDGVQEKEMHIFVSDSIAGEYGPLRTTIARHDAMPPPIKKILDIKERLRVIEQDDNVVISTITYDEESLREIGELLDKTTAYLKSMKK